MGPQAAPLVRLAHFYYITSMALKRFPIGVQDFARIREDGMYYVDKTDLVYKLTHTDPYYLVVSRVFRKNSLFQHQI